jgi:hypothetical protein
MFNEINNINVPGVLTAAIASFVLGAVWFTVIFSRSYAVALGRENAPKEKPAPIFLIGPFVCGIVTTFTTALLLLVMGIQSYGGAILFGAVVGLGYLACTTVNTAINPNIPRPLLYGLISGSYFFISSILISVILVAMR